MQHEFVFVRIPSLFVQVRTRERQQHHSKVLVLVLVHSKELVQGSSKQQRPSWQLAWP
jgi:hypothetical protein